jgi:hypothetical protein
MARRGYLTSEAIAKAKPRPTFDRWLTDEIGERNAGRLVVRISPKGIRRFYFRYTSPDGGRVHIPIGVFSETPRPDGLTLEQARTRAADLRAIHKTQESRDLRAHFAREERARREAEQVKLQRVERERAAADAMLRYTVKALATTYVTHLERQGKRRSAQDARNIFKNHLDGTQYGECPAKDLTSRDVTALLRMLTEAGKGRTAAKLRSYLRAAYALAIRAELDANAPSEFIGFALDANPVAPVGALAEFSRARDRTLTEAELVAYWRRLDGVKSEAVRAALKLALLLGGQRAAQLVRLRRVDVNLSGSFVILRDPKGARKHPRIHELPITKAAAEIFVPMLDRAAALDCDWVFTSDGKTPIHADTLTAAVRDIAADMKAANETPEAFKFSDLRRTAETMMAGMGISRDIRAQIQSHGLGGIQQRHYDRHDYRAEKKRALEAWARRLRDHVLSSLRE